MVVEEYSLKGRGLKLNSSNDVAQFCKEIDQKIGLTSVCLSGNTFGVEAAKSIAESLAKQHNLQIISFSDMFTGRLKDEIPLALDAFVDALIDKKIIELDLSDNAFGPAGAKPLMRLLINNRNIQVLKLNNNGLGIEGARLISEALLEAHDKNVEQNVEDNLQIIVAGRNRMESPGIEHLSKALGAYKSLKKIQIPQNSIRPDGIKVLMEALKDSPNLEHLDLEDNTFTEIGSLAMASSLASWKNLSILNIGDCLLGKNGAVHVIKALTGSHDKLTQLHLAFNEIGEDGVNLVPAMLQNKSELIILELNGNAFDAECSAVERIKSILDKFGHGDALDELDEMELESEAEEEEEEVEEDVEEDVEVDKLAEAIGKI